MFCKKSMQTAIFLGMSVSSLIVRASADDFYVVPFGSYLHPGGDTEGFDGFGAGLAVGKEINDQFNIEVRGFWQRYDNDYSCCKGNSAISSLHGDSTLTGGTVDVQWFLMRDAFSPYVVAGVGGMNTHYEMDSVVLGKQTSYRADTPSFIFESGVGTTYQITDDVAFRSDVRYRLNSFIPEVGDSDVLHNLTVTFGFVL